MPRYRVTGTVGVNIDEYVYAKDKREAESRVLSGFDDFYESDLEAEEIENA